MLNRRHFSSSLVLPLLATGAVSPLFAQGAIATVGQAAPDFSALDTTGKSHKLSDFKGKLVVLEWINPGCPFVRKHYSGNMQSLQKGGKTGRQMSEELAKMAAQQEMIRRAVKDMEGKEKGKESGGKQGGQPSLGQLIKEMEKTESDLVNKKLTQETINRQQEIVTRLLEAENAEKERDQEKQRESQQAKEQQPTLPPSFEKYLKEKQKQVELLKTLSPSLSPYYKQEVNEYFQKIEN